ncbi:MAG: glycosyltransferase [Hyphomicrobiales bacterium]|nr:glycosyltransferase [Hyphomicrobiales bacterium]
MDISAADLLADSGAPPTADRGAVAIVHDWCPSFRGGERVLAHLADMHPGANIYTLFDFLPADVKARHFLHATFHISPMNRLPGVERYYRSLFFLCPFFIEQFDVTHADLVISSSAAFARGVITRPDQPHFCYVHSPVRYAWDEQFSYMEQGRLGYGPKGLLFRHFLHKLRTWDVRTSHGPDVMAANSNFIRRRIKRIYGRDALVIFPPVEVDEFALTETKDDYYITASFLAPYKRTDLVIEAFREMPEKRLLVVGDGQQSKQLRKLAGPNITFAGFLSRAAYVKAVAEARALVFAGCEDFGIALAEAQAAGTPLIALGRGGAADIVRAFGIQNHPTGVLFRRQTVAAVKDAVALFEANRQEITPEACRVNAMRFNSARFKAEISAAIGRTHDLHV